MAGPIDPWSAGLMAVGGIAQSAMGGPKVSSANSPYYSVFDSSGWAVNTGSGSATATASKSQGLVGQLLDAMQNPLVAGAVLLGAYLYFKK